MFFSTTFHDQNSYKIPFSQNHVACQSMTYSCNSYFRHNGIDYQLGQSLTILPTYLKVPSNPHHSKTNRHQILQTRAHLHKSNIPRTPMIRDELWYHYTAHEATHLRELLDESCDSNYIDRYTSTRQNPHRVGTSNRN